MAKYTKKPEQIEAIQWDGTYAGMQQISGHFLGLNTARCDCHPAQGTVSFWYISTVNGSKNVLSGHYVYKNETGLFWTMRPEDLEAEYDEVIE